MPSSVAHRLEGKKEGGGEVGLGPQGKESERRGLLGWAVKIERKERKKERRKERNEDGLGLGLGLDLGLGFGFWK